ncbi:MAG TPA: 50S ribosomal protein L4 [candidate division Zixibacteria bacterium]|nr:50S ribosomal protein L4 [candidate division Zixibacteria bacterium]
MKAKVYSQDGAEVGQVDLNPDIFGVEPNEAIVHQYVVNYLSNQRQGTSAVKGRSDVSGGGSKPWRQKGTGRARVGTIRSPLWRGGGIVHGPQKRSFKSAFPKQMKRLALKSALSDRAQNDRILVLEKCEFSEPKTKGFVDLLAKLKLQESNSVLFLEEGFNKTAALSARNLPGVSFKAASLVNAYDVVRADRVVITRAGLSKVEEVFA